MYPLGARGDFLLLLSSLGSGFMTTWSIPALYTLSRSILRVEGMIYVTNEMSSPRFLKWYAASASVNIGIYILSSFTIVMTLPQLLWGIKEGNLTCMAKLNLTKFRI